MNLGMLREDRLVGRAWLVSRLVMAVICFSVVYPARPVLGDVGIYDEWSDLLIEGTFPADDVRWQYPPLAALPMLIPRLLGPLYGLGFAFLVVAADYAVMRVLVRKGESPEGAWCWVGGIFLLGPVCFFRFDTLVVVPVVFALLMVARSRLFGALVAVGALMKVWPALLFLALCRGRAAIGAAAAFLVAAAGLAGVIALVADDEWSFLKGQRDRGIEIEALVATPFHVARWFGWSGDVRYQYGSWELTGAGVPAAVNVSVVITLVGLAAVALAVLRRPARDWSPARGADAVLAGLLAAIAGSRVLSPQYLVWVVGVAAVCLTMRRTRQRPAVAVLLAAIALTQLEFPILWQGVRDGQAFPASVLILRNVLVLVATVLAVVAVWRDGGEARDDPSVTERRPRPAGTG
ncbi:glycosyltransferase 87 family protein [Spirillospora sp. CA-294931]|uniref:glycosyltransferase 87 family protein n=1 Tax=Spirillospora sp. CA-294931 TaxID=3240042 RepID=UPI003D91CF03